MAISSLVMKSNTFCPTSYEK